MRQAPAAVLAKVPHLPETPGVYLWKDAERKVLYVGKAKRLRSRVRSYFTADQTGSVKTQALVRLIDDVDTIVVPDESHALILENTLIKEHRPRFNISLRDDKSYPYIKVTVAEPFPRVFVTRRWVDDGSRYFGPYTDVGAMRRALNVVNRIFTVRSCHYDLPEDTPERPCLDYHIGRCLAPCVALQSMTAYRMMIDEVILFLEGRTAEVVKRVRRPGSLLLVDELQLTLDGGQCVRVQQLAQLGVTEELAQLRLIDGKRLRAPLGQRGIAVVDVVRDVTEEE